MSSSRAKKKRTKNGPKTRVKKSGGGGGAKTPGQRYAAVLRFEAAAGATLAALTAKLEFAQDVIKVVETF